MPARSLSPTAALATDMPDGSKTRATAYPRHEEETLHLAAKAEDVFAFADDHQNLASHMNEKNAMMAGSKFTTEIDGLHARAVGDHIRMGGRVMGLRLELDEVVTERAPPSHKAWETVGAPKLVVIGPYKMGFDVAPDTQGSAFRVSIDYALPKRNAWIGRLFGRAYARWCVRQMTTEVARRFA